MTPTLGVFGKLPSTGDFVALHAATPVAVAFQSWLQHENDQLSAKGQALPNAPIRFLYSDPAGSGTLIGILLPSRDAVGRTFPIAVFRSLEPAIAAQQFPYLPAAYATFLQGVGRVLQSHGPHADPHSLLRNLDHVPAPSPVEIDHARQWTQQALDATPGKDMLEALFGALEQGVHFHGIHMFRSACRRIRDTPPQTANVYLECRCSDDVQLAFWLMFAKGQLNWPQAPPALFWTDFTHTDQRLIVALGSPHNGPLLFFSDPHIKAERLWPTTTSSSSSIEAGRAAMTSAERWSIEPPAPTASALLAALAVANPKPLPA